MGLDNSGNTGAHISHIRHDRRWCSVHGHNRFLLVCQALRLPCIFCARLFDPGRMCLRWERTWGDLRRCLDLLVLANEDQISGLTTDSRITWWTRKKARQSGSVFGPFRKHRSIHHPGLSCYWIWRLNVCFWRNPACDNLGEHRFHDLQGCLVRRKIAGKRLYMVHLLLMLLPIRNLRLHQHSHMCLGLWSIRKEIFDTRECDRGNRGVGRTRQFR